MGLWLTGESGFKGARGCYGFGLLFIVPTVKAVDAFTRLPRGHGALTEEPLLIQVAGASDPGSKPGNDEDAIWWSIEGAQPGSRQAILIVADGVGGAAAGEVARQLAVREFRQSLSSEINGGSARDELVAAVHRANAAVFTAAHESPELEGMGTTLTAAAIVGSRLYVVHVGDSRCYLIRGGAPRQLTVDHTWVAEEVESGRLGVKQAATHPARKAISRSVGIESRVEPDLYGPVDLQDEDTIILCSDGLTDVMSDLQIASIASSPTIETVASSLVAAANRAGGPDNISAITARVLGSSGAPLSPEWAKAPYAGRRKTTSPAVPSEQKKRPPIPAAVALIFPAALMFVFGGLGFFALQLSGGNNDQAVGVSLTASAPVSLITSPSDMATPVPVTRAPSAGPTAIPTVGPAPTVCDDGKPAFAHTVEGGQTLSSIATDFNVGVDDIISCDPSIEDPDSLSIGQQIEIPCGDSGCPGEGPDAGVPGGVRNPGEDRLWRDGDGLSRPAQRERGDSGSESHARGPD